MEKSVSTFPLEKVPEHLRDIAKRFVEYAKIDTQSDGDSETTPSTSKQHVLADLLVNQLKELGVKDVVKTDNCIVLGTIDQVGVDDRCPTLCLISHMDVASECSASGISPQLYEHYHIGDNVTYTDEMGNITVLTHYQSCKDDLDLCDGHTLITTDGKTLLGGDDKAGVASIMEAAKTMLKDKTTKHCRIRICFTPDEEIGRGAKDLTKDLLDSDFAVTIDGGSLGEYSWETFNAASLKVVFEGHAVHPGSAYGRLASSLRVATTFVNSLPEEKEAYFSREREGYIHVIDIKGNSEQTTVSLLLRSFSQEQLKEFRGIVERCAKESLETHFASLKGLGLCSDNMSQVFKVSFHLNMGYNNMGEIMGKDAMAMRFVNEVVAKSIEEVGVKPRCIPIRGGTDGIKITEIGVPCPNIFTGTSSMHSISEFVSLDAMHKVTETILRMSQNILSLK